MSNGLRNGPLSPSMCNRQNVISFMFIAFFIWRVQVYDLKIDSVDVTFFSADLAIKRILKITIRIGIFKLFWKVLFNNHLMSEIKYLCCLGNTFSINESFERIQNFTIKTNEYISPKVLWDIHSSTIQQLYKPHCIMSLLLLTTQSGFML